MSQTRAVAKPFKPRLIILIVAGLLFSAWSYARYEERREEQRLMSNLSDTQRVLVAEINKAGGDITSSIQRYKRDQTKEQLRVTVADLSLKLEMANRELADKRAENTLLKSELEDLKLILYTGHSQNNRQIFTNADVMEMIRNLEQLISQMSSKDGADEARSRELRIALAEISVLVESFVEESELTGLLVRRTQN